MEGEMHNIKIAYTGGEPFASEEVFTMVEWSDRAVFEAITRAQRMAQGAT